MTEIKDEKWIEEKVKDIVNEELKKGKCNEEEFEILKALRYGDVKRRNDIKAEFDEIKMLSASIKRYKQDLEGALEDGDLGAVKGFEFKIKNVEKVINQKEKNIETLRIQLALNNRHLKLYETMCRFGVEGWEETQQ